MKWGSPKSGAFGGGRADGGQGRHREAGRVTGQRGLFCERKRAAPNGAFKQNSRHVPGIFFVYKLARLSQRHSVVKGAAGSPALTKRFRVGVVGRIDFSSVHTVFTVAPQISWKRCFFPIIPI